MNESLESRLCTRCGLCCNGSLFADVEITNRESLRMELAGLETEDDSLLLQPCAALKGARCSIYAVRPKCCRTFECALLQRVRRGEFSVEAALEIVSTARALRRGSDAFQRFVEDHFLGIDFCVTPPTAARITTRHA